MESHRLRETCETEANYPLKQKASCGSITPAHCVSLATPPQQYSRRHHRERQAVTGTQGRMHRGGKTLRVTGRPLDWCRPITLGWEWSAFFTFAVPVMYCMYKIMAFSNDFWFSVQILVISLSDLINPQQTDIIKLQSLGHKVDTHFF